MDSSPQNINFEHPDEDSAKLNIPAERIDKNFDTFLSNSFGFGGTNSTLVIRKFKRLTNYPLHHDELKIFFLK